MLELLCLAKHQEEIGFFLVYLLVILVIFLLIREVLCWYWKINKVVSLLEDILITLEEKQSDQKD